MNSKYSRLGGIGNTIFNRKNPALMLILGFLLVSILATTSGMGFLYRTAYDQHLVDLEDTAAALAGMMEAIAKIGEAQDQGKSSSEKREEVLTHIHDEIKKLNPNRASAELVLGWREHDRIVLRIRNSATGQLGSPHAVPFDSQLAEPMRRALQGTLGAEELPDYEGTRVLAGYAFVPTLEMGVVFKIGAVEERAPYLRIISIVSVLLLGMAFLGGASFFLLIRPIRAQAETALFESEHKYHTLVELASDGIFLCDRDGNYLDANLAGCTLLGYTRKELLRLNVREILHPDEVRNSPPKLNQIPNNAPLVTERVLVKKNGDMVHTEIVSNRLPDGSIQAIVRDVTERNRVQKALRENEARLQALFDHSPISVWEEDFSAVQAHFQHLRQKGIQDFRAYWMEHPEDVLHCASLVKITDINQTSVKFFEAENKSAIPLNLPSYFTAESLAVFQEELITLAEGKTRFQSEIPIQAPISGRKLLSLSLAVVPGFEKTLSRVVVSFTDLTERVRAEEAVRESERRLKMAQHIAHIGSWDWDIVSGNLTWSDEVYRIFGLLPQEIEPSYESFLDFIHPEDRQGLQDAVTSAVAGTAPYTFKHRVLRRDGSIRFVVEHGEVYRDKQGNPLHMLGTVHDVTEQEETARKLAEGQEIFNQFFNYSPLANYIKNDQLHYISMNPTGDRMARLVVDTDWVGKSVTELFPPEVANRITKDDLEILNGTGAKEVVDTIPSPGGPRHYFSVRFPIVLPSGRRLLGGQRLDITDRVRAEEEVKRLNATLEARVAARTLQLSESEEQFRVLAESSPVGIFRASETGEFLYVNNAFARILDAPEANCLGRSWQDFIHPEDQAVFAEHTQNSARLQGRLDVEHRTIRQDSQLHWVHHVSDAFVDGSRVRWRVGIVEDITARKTAEEALKERTVSLSEALELNERMLAASSMGIAAYHESGQCVFANEALSNMVGATQEQVLAQNFLRIPSWERHGITAMGRRILSTGVAEFKEVHVTTTFGKESWLDMYLTRFNRGRQPHLLLMVNDISARKRTEMEVRELQEKMVGQQKLATIGQLTATVSHELRNPLGTIRTNLFTLRERLGANSPYKSSLDRMERNVVRCDNIITDLLDFSRNRAANPEATNLDQWLQDLLKEQIVPSWVQLEHQLGTGGLVIHVDHDRMRRVMINLLENAVQAMDSARETDPNRISRLLVTSRKKPDRVEIEVADTGPGMTPEVLSKIFDPLFSTKIYGVGLGLPTVRQIMEQEHGEISITSEPGRGTAARLWLPLTNYQQVINQ